LLALPRHPALGLRRGVEFTTTTVQLDGDATLLLYTDGLVERRDIGLVERLDTLVEHAAALHGTDLDAMCIRLRDTLRDVEREDDATVFAVRFRT
jgi:serine phosphatase RsbU (regulator of sigma subunit)